MRQLGADGRGGWTGWWMCHERTTDAPGLDGRDGTSTGHGLGVLVVLHSRSRWVAPSSHIDGGDLDEWNEC